MGCLLSSARDANPLRSTASIGEVAVFTPGFRIPKHVDLYQPLGDCLPKSLLDHLSALRSRIVALAAQEARLYTKPKRRSITRHGTFSIFCTILF